MEKNTFLDSIRPLYRPDLVQIDSSAIKKLALEAGSASLVGSAFPFQPAPFVGFSGPTTPEAVKAVRYLLALTALQYRFWELEPKTGAYSRYSFDGKVGSTGMMLAFDRAWGSEADPGPGILAAARSPEGVSLAFKPNFPDPSSRCRILSEALGPRGREVSHQVLAYIASAHSVNVALASYVATEIPTAYGDPFLKKAMLFLGLVASWLRQYVAVADDLLAYADYQVPSVLRHRGVLRYSHALAAAVDGQHLLASGGPEESAIRAGTVLACEEVAKTFGVTAAEVDWWCFGQRKEPVRPFHLTLTTHY